MVRKTSIFDLQNVTPNPLLGEIEVFVDGQSVLLVDRVALCEEPTARICAAHFQTFFGGLSLNTVILIP
jgi:hypothetical protein